MPEISDAILVAIISGIISLALASPGIAAFAAQRRKTKAETSKTFAEASDIYAGGLAKAAIRELENSDVMRDLRSEVDSLKEDFHNLLEIVLCWSDGIEILTKQVAKYETPYWEPDARHKKLVKQLKETIGVSGNIK